MHRLTVVVQLMNSSVLSPTVNYSDASCAKLSFASISVHKQKTCITISRCKCKSLHCASVSIQPSHSSSSEE